MINAQQFTAIMLTLAQTFRVELGQLALDGYVMALSDLTDGEMEAGARLALKRCKFMPAPSELLAFAQGNVELEIAEAWGEVREALDAVDIWGSVDFGPLANAVLRNMGGWRELCGASVKDLVWRRKEFERLYRDFRDTPAHQLKGAPHIGLHGLPAPKRATGALPPVSTEDRVGITAVSDLIRGLADKHDAS